MHGTAPDEGFWGLLTAAERDVLSGVGRTGTYPAGTTMCVEGDPATHVFILTFGWVKVYSVTSDGHEIVLALRGQGDIIGELAGETTGRRGATVQAIGEVRSLIILHDRFSSFLDAYPGAGRAYRRTVTQRWTDTDRKLRSRSYSSGAERLASLLLELARRHGRQTADGIEIDMPLSQQELASWAGASRATLTRALATWRSRRLVLTSQLHMTILDPEALRQIAGD